MKQRIRVIGIIKTSEGFLLLKRSKGRSEELPSWEFPTGKIQYGEQPEESMTRAIYEYLETQVNQVKLTDVVTFTGLSTSSELENLYIVYEVELLDGKIKLQTNGRYSAFKYVKSEELVALNLDEATLSVLEIENDKIRDKQGREKVNYRSTANSAIIYTDGASRGNPGPAGIGYYIIDENNEVLKQGGEFIGFATSRIAEYYGLKEACEQAIELGLTKVRFVSDNLMMVNQMNGIYKVKNKDLMPIYEDIQKLLTKFEAVSFTHVKREFNTEADAQATKAILDHFRRPRDGVSY